MRSLVDGLWSPVARLMRLRPLPMQDVPATTASPFARMPGVNSTGPEEEALLVVAYLLDDVGWKRQMHNADGFLADRGSCTQQGGRGVLDDVSLARIRITPALWADAVDDR